MYTIVILAGGLATRLRPLTETIPKSLIEINGIPFVFHQLNLLKSKGIKNVIFCTGYLGESIKEAIGNGNSLGMNINYINDGESLLGTGGAIKQALPLLEESFFITYGDSYLDCDYLELKRVFEKNKFSAIMSIYKNNNLWDKSNVEFNSDQSKIVAYSKLNKTKAMNYIDFGLSVVNKSIFNDFYNTGIFDLAELFERMSHNGILGGFEVKQRFYEIGSIQGIEELNQHLKKN
jgi:NDP-sugar pyrophosphorylase family protein